MTTTDEMTPLTDGEAFYAERRIHHAHGPDTVLSDVECVEADYARSLDRRLIAAEAELAGMRWQPIKTAPKDGTRFLAWNGKEIFCKWSDRLGMWDVPYIRLSRLRGVQPSHWRPLPAAPDDGEGK